MNYNKQIREEIDIIVRVSLCFTWRKLLLTIESVLLKSVLIRKVAFETSKVFILE